MTSPAQRDCSSRRQEERCCISPDLCSPCAHLRPHFCRIWGTVTMYSAVLHTASKVLPSPVKIACCVAIQVTRLNVNLSTRSEFCDCLSPPIQRMPALCHRLLMQYYVGHYNRCLAARWRLDL